jgi:hypothetical protein
MIPYTEKPEETLGKAVERKMKECPSPGGAFLLNIFFYIFCPY